MNNYESPLARAIDLLRHGYSLPFSLKRELIERGDLDAAQLAEFEARHWNQATHE